MTLFRRAFGKSAKIQFRRPMRIAISHEQQQIRAVHPRHSRIDGTAYLLTNEILQNFF